jgi:hypothetical protein
VTVQPAVNLPVGVCFDATPIRAGEPIAPPGIALIDCAQPHHFEVFAIVDHPASRASEYPGAEQLYSFASDACLGEFAGYVGAELADSALDLTAVQPDEGAWAAGDRHIVCVAVRADYEAMTGSVRNSGG